MFEFGFVKVNVTGLNGSGPISAPGLKVGDRFLLGYSPAGGGGGLESIITVADQVQQLVGFDWSPFTFDLIFLRGI